MLRGRDWDEIDIAEKITGYLQALEDKVYCKVIRYALHIIP